MPVSHLLSLATAVPPHVIEQDEAKAIGRRAFKRHERCSTAWRACSTMPGSPRRHLVAPLDWYEAAAWLGRAQPRLSRSRRGLFEEAALAAIAKAGLTPGDIDGVVTVSTTGIATPSLEARVGPRIGLRGDVRRVPVFGLGCAGGVSGLATAARLAASEPGQQLAVRHGRNLLDLDPPRQRRPGGDRRHRLVRRRRRGGGGPRGRRRRAREHRAARPRNCGPTRWASWAGGSRTRASAWCSTAPSRRSSRPSWRRRSTRCARELGRRARRHRPLLLPPRRGQGDRRDRDRARLAAGRAQPRARGAARSWQYERADGAVRARPADPARACPSGR